MNRPNPFSTLLAAVVLAAAAVLTSACSSSPTAPSDSPVTPTHPLPPLSVMLAEKTLGSDTAPVTMIGYSSLTCPHCAAFDLDTLPQIKSTYIDTGRVKYVYRDFPLDNAALAASMVARCSGDKFFTTIDTLFRTQSSWASGNYVAGIKAAVSGLDITSSDVDACLADAELKSGIMAIEQAGIQQYSVNAVPTFLINGQVVLGAQPFSVFAAIIDGL